MKICARYARMNPQELAALGGSFCYLSDLKCLSNHLPAKSPTKRAMTATTNENMYRMVCTPFPRGEPDKGYYNTAVGYCQTKRKGLGEGLRAFFSFLVHISPLNYSSPSKLYSW